MAYIRLSTEVVQVPRMAISRILTWPCVGMRESSRNLEKLSVPLQLAKSLLTCPTISQNTAKTPDPHMWAWSDESGPRAGRGGGRWSLQVASKCFEQNGTGHRNPSKGTQRSLNITFRLIFRGKYTSASDFVQIGCINESKLDILLLNWMYCIGKIDTSWI